MIGGNVEIGRVSRQVEPRGSCGYERAGKSRQHHRQAERADKDLRGEQGPAERDVVDRGQPGPSAAGDEQAPLGDTEASPAGEHTGRGTAHQLGRRLSPDRGAHADHHFGDDRGAQALSERELTVTGPDDLVDLGVLSLGVAAQEIPGNPTERSGDEQGQHAPRWRGMLDGRLEAASLVVEREPLHVEQE